MDWHTIWITKQKEEYKMYVPVLKNRTVEMSVLSQLAGMGVFDNTNILPLVELIQEKTRTNNKNTIIDDLSELLVDNPQMSIMIDFLKSAKLNNTTDSIRNYVTQSTRQVEFCIEEMLKFKPLSARIIPVISYLSDNVSLERIVYEATEYRKSFPRIAFRIKTQEFEHIFSCVESLIKENDLLILDIESSSHSNPVFKKIYKRIADSKKIKKFISVVINANRPETLTNKSLTHGEPIPQIDNSLRESYSLSMMNRFNGFGDYACIVASLPTTGGTISPAGVFYSNENNFFVAYRGRTPHLSEFPDYIAPNIVKSEYWSEFDDDHHEKCPGCREISAIINGEKSGKNQAQWKMITMLHYIYTMYETNA